MESSDPATRAVEAFERVFDDQPTTTATAPGRVNLVGGHTDYNDGLVLPVGVDRRTAVAGRPRTDDRFVVHSETVGETLTVDDDPRGAWTDYVAGVRWALRDAGHHVGGVDLAVASDVPVGGGLSSSAALEVAACRCLDDLFSLGLDGRTAASRCKHAENQFVGVPCGILDQFAAALAPASGGLELDCRTLEFEPAPLGKCGIVVLDTGIEHALAESAFADRVAECRRGVDRLSTLLDRPVESLRTVSVEAFEAVAADIEEPIRSRCRHVVTENRRVRTAASTLRDEAYERAGAAMDASHRSLRDDYAVSCRELDAAVEAGRETAGIVGSRLTGAGFGGATVHLVTGDAASVAETLADRYRARVGTTPDVYTCVSSPGAYAPSASST